jgi:regulator of sigma E protease
MMVSTDSTGAKPAQGLKEGDIFARLGALEFPSLADGTAEIKRHRGGTIEVDVLRGTPLSRVAIKPDPTVKTESDGVGRIGFVRSETDAIGNWVALPPASIIDNATGEPRRPAASSLITRPGTRVTEVAGKPVSNFAEIRAALRAATRKAFRTIRRDVPGPLSRSNSPWRMSRQQLITRRGIYPAPISRRSSSWAGRAGSALISSNWSRRPLERPARPSQARAVDAVKMGVSETKRVMMTTYLTFARLFQGTVKIEHLKGPVGIAHLGTRVVERGFIWLLFFMALISINLAVVNFLPLPIVDGGQFVFLIIEQIRGRPVSVEIQSFATVAGLVLIGAIFLIVTFHDIANLFG